MKYRHLPALLSLFLPTAINASTFVEIQTNKGGIIVELNEQANTKNDQGTTIISTTNNFLAYVEEKFYDATIFHRVIEDFVIQGGGLISKTVLKDGKPSIKKTTRPPIVLQDHDSSSNKDKFNNNYGTIAMARLNTPDSATAQFFINTNPNNNDPLNYSSALPPTKDKSGTPETRGYAVFGNVISGLTPLPTSEGEKKPIPATFDNPPNHTVNIINAVPVGNQSRPTEEVIINYIRKIEIPLIFDLKEGVNYKAADTINLSLKELKSNRQEQVDLWVAVVVQQEIYYLDQTGLFTLTPTPFKQGIKKNENDFTLLNLTVPANLTLGDYTFYATFSEPNTADIIAEYTSAKRSNLADITLKIQEKKQATQ